MTVITPAVDASTPSSFTMDTSDSASSKATGAFNPPANSLVVVAVGCNAASGTTRTVTISNNGTALTWTQIGIRNKASSGGQDGFAGLWCATLTAARTGMTVTATPNNSTSSTIAIKPYVLTGVDMATPVGASVTGSATPSGSFTTTALTTQKDNSLGILILNDWNPGSGTPSGTDSTAVTYVPGSHIVGLAGYKTLGAAGSSGTFAIGGVSGGPEINYVAAEIRGVEPVSGDFFAFF